MLLKDGTQKYSPKTHLPSTATNLPKAKTNTIFFRGTGTDATDKIIVNGCEMYRQDYWIKGKYLVERLSFEPEIYASNSHRINKQRKRILDSIERAANEGGMK